MIYESTRKMSVKEQEAKASFYYWDARVQAGCEECSMETAHLLSCDEARDEWNISHGYKGDA